MIIILPIENSLREKISKIYLAYQILKRTNYKVIIGGQRYLNYKIKNFKNCVWLDKNTFHERLKKRDIHKKNHLIILDEEGPISFIHKFTQKTLYSKFLFRIIDKILLWGEKDTSKLPKNYKSKKKMLIYGHPKFDLLKKKNSKIFADQVDLIKKKYKNFIFIPGSYSLDNRRNEYEALTKNWGKKYNIENKILIDFLKYHELEKENYKNFLNFVKKISLNCPDKIFVFRQHPTENYQKLKKFLGNIPNNLKIVNKFTVTPWIMSCNYFLHSGCTTAFEAAILKKKIIFFRQEKIAKFERYQKFKLSNLNYTSEEKCFSLINNLNSKIFYKAQNIGKLINNYNEKNSFYISFTNYLNNLKFKNPSHIEYRKINNNFLLIFFKNLNNLLNKILSYVKNKIILKTFLHKFVPERHIFSKDLALRKFKNLKKIEIMSFFLKIDPKFFGNLKVQKISNSVFKIEKQ